MACHRWVVGHSPVASRSMVADRSQAAYRREAEDHPPAASRSRAVGLARPAAPAGSTVDHLGWWPANHPQWAHRPEYWSHPRTAGAEAVVEERFVHHLLHRTSVPLANPVLRTRAAVAAAEARCRLTGASSPRSHRLLQRPHQLRFPPLLPRRRRRLRQPSRPRRRAPPRHPRRDRWRDPRRLRHSPHTSRTSEGDLLRVSR